MGYYTFDVQVSYVGTHTFSSNLRAFIFNMDLPSILLKLVKFMKARALLVLEIQQ